MNVLQIGLASLLAQKSETQLNDPQVHQIKYGRRIFSKSFVIVKTPRDPHYQAHQLLENVNVFPTLSRNRYWFAWDAWSMATRIMDRNKIDLIITQDPFVTGLIGYLLKKKFCLPLCVNNVCDFIDNPFWIQEWRMNRLLNPIGKYILKRADSIRVDSQKEYDKMIHLGIDKNRIWNIPFILNDADKFINAKTDIEFRKKILGEKFDHIVLFVGRFEDQKDFPTLFKTVRKVIQSQPRTLFLIVGDGKKSNELKARARSLGIQDNLFFSGWVDYFELPRYYAICDSLLLTSKYETSPRVLIFACLSRKPIVTTDVSGVRDFVEERLNGFIVPIMDDDGLAKGVLRLLEDSQRAKAMGEYGSQKVQPLLDEEKILQDYRKMCEFTLNSGNGDR